MSTKILAFAGCKQSGKDTAGHFVAGLKLLEKKVVDKFHINDAGDLIIPTGKDEAGNDTNGMLKMNRFDAEFCELARDLLWPHVKMYAFGDYLKRVCMDIFRLTYEQCYGTNEDKNTITKVPLSLVVHSTSKKKKVEGFATAREVLQWFGTEVCRAGYPDCWVDIVLSQIEADQPELAIITDLRFPNELEKVKQADGKVVMLTRRLTEVDGHSSENLDALDKSKIDAVIDNQSIDITAKNALIHDFIKSSNLMSCEVDTF